MISTLKGFVVTAAALVLWGCGSESTGPKSQVQTLNGVEYVALEGAAFKQGDGLVEGTGKMLFLKPLTNPDNNFDLQMNLGKSGSACLVSMSDALLNAGLKVCFVSEDGRNLKVSLHEGASVQDISNLFVPVASSADDLSVSMDIHGHGHLVFWLNGGEEVEVPFTLRPTGTLWGLILTDARVQKSIQGPAKEAH